MNQYYENIYLKKTTKNEIDLFEYFLDFFNISNAEFFVTRLSPCNLLFSSKKDKNIEGRMTFSEDGIYFDFSKQIFFDDEVEAFEQRLEIFDYLESYKPFFEDKDIDFSDKSFKYTIKDSISDFRKTYKPEDHNYAYTREELLNFGEGTFRINRMIKNNGDKLISCLILNYTIKKELNVDADNSVFAYFDENFNHLIRVTRTRPNILDLDNFSVYKDLLYFDENGCLTKESKELLELNFKY